MKRNVWHGPPSRLLTERVYVATLVAISAVMLSWVAIFNASALVFPDTIAYATAALRREMPGMFSVYYSIFIFPLHQGLTFWPIVFVQGAILGHLIYLVTRCVFDERVSKLATLLIVAALCLFSSLPWTSGQVMPDVFSSVLVLGIFLLAFCTDRLSRGELVYVAALTTAATTTHLSHVPVAFGLLLLCGALWRIFAHRTVRLGRSIALLLLPFAVALGSMLGINWFSSGQIALARNSNVFLLAKWIEEGPALSYLSQACPAIHYSLCAHLDELPSLDQDALKWSGESPFYKVGGLDTLEPEARSIVWAVVRSQPLAIVQKAVADVGRQLLRFEIGEGLTPEAVQLVVLYTREVLHPQVANSLLQSKQAEGRLPIREFRQLHIFGLLLGCALSLILLIVRRRLLPRRLAAFYIFVVLAIFWNAIVTGTLSGPFDRYLARLVWLIGFSGLLGLLYLMRV